MITSTIGTIYDKKLGKTVFNEEDHAIVGKETGAYVESKIRAEEAGWDFYNKLSDDDKFDVITVHPGGIIGPTLGGP